MTTDTTTTTPTNVHPMDLPVAYLQLAMGENADVKREQGLILTQEDIINLKLYVKAGLALPLQDNEVVSYIGYSACGIPGLEPADIKALFLAIKSNVVQWDPLETDIKQQSINLDIFSDRITSTGGVILKTIDQMPVTAKVLQKLGTAEITKEALEKVDPNFKPYYDSDDQNIAYELKKILEDIKKDVTEQRDSTSALKTRISNFRSEIATKLEPQVANKRELIKKSNIKSNNETLRNQIGQKNDRIDQLKKDYDKYFGLAFTGAAAGLIGIAITAGIFGDKAEKARKERDQLISEKDALVAQLTTGESLEKAVENLGNKFFDVHTRLIDAEQAAEHLEFVWNTMLSNIESSLKSFDEINDGLSLLRFTDTFKKVINPWTQVKDYASKLIKVFDKALEVYRQQQGLK